MKTKLSLPLTTLLLLPLTTALPPTVPNHHGADLRPGLTSNQPQIQLNGKTGNTNRCEFSIAKSVVGLVLGALVLMGEELWRWEMVGEEGLVLEGL